MGTCTFLTNGDHNRLRLNRAFDMLLHQRRGKREQPFLNRTEQNDTVIQRIRERQPEVSAAAGP